MAWPFTRGAKRSSKKSEAQGDIPTNLFERGIRARVRRTSPATFNGRQTKGYASGDYQHLRDLDDLQRRIREICGGGEFLVEIFEQGTTNHIDTYAMAIQGDPLIDGQPIPPEEKPVKTKEMEESDEVRKLRDEKAKLEAMADLAKSEGHLKKIRKDEGLDQEDVDPRELEIQGLHTRLDEMADGHKKLMETITQMGQQSAQDREEKRQQQTMEMFMKLLETMVRGKGDDKTFEMMKEIAGSNTKQIELVMKQMEANRQEQSASQKAMMDLVMQRGDQVASNQMDFFVKALATAQQFAEGKLPNEEDEPQTWAGFADRLSNRLFESVNAIVALKGQQADAAKSEIDRTIHEAAREAVREHGGGKALPAPPNQRAAPAAPPRPVTPPQEGPPRAPAVRQPPKPPPREPDLPMTDEEIRAVRPAMDRMLNAFIQGAQKRVRDPWGEARNIAIKELPPRVVAELVRSRKSGDAFAAVLRKYGSPEMAEAALRVGSDLWSQGKRPSDEAPPAAPPTKPAAKPPAAQAPARPSRKRAPQRPRRRGPLTEAAVAGATERPPEAPEETEESEEGAEAAEAGEPAKNEE